MSVVRNEFQARKENSDTLDTQRGDGVAGEKADSPPSDCPGKRVLLRVKHSMWPIKEWPSIADTFLFKIERAVEGFGQTNMFISQCWDVQHRLGTMLSPSNSSFTQHRLTKHQLRTGTSPGAMMDKTE